MRVTALAALIILTEEGDISWFSSVRKSASCPARSGGAWLGPHRALRAHLQQGDGRLRRIMGGVAQRAECSPAHGIHLLGQDSRELARRFSTTGIDRFDDPAIGYDDGLTSVAGAWLECRMVDRIPAGDHRIVLAAPVRGGHGGRDQSRPLLYHDRRYTSVTEPKEGTKP
ncbi:flavin reductase family protein [Streptomyces mirabilis]|uniref:flavin reductase family protein n=1 Tax=Streptomyces TaxID=1883 RepID=UPI000BD83A26|nr:flavin reductase family protein [Streptomyces sp. OK228]SOE33851.1 Flavin reductase like domain-containing protein [Streptomyces sp. OK228]